MKILFFIFLLVLAFPSIHALDCSKTIHQDYCNEIQSSSLTDEEKSYLLSDIFSDTKQYPDYQIVQQWNANLRLNQKPANVSLNNNGVIKNAWMKVLAVMPSVESNGTLYLDTQGTLVSGYNYEFQIPSGRQAGDCDTSYYLRQNTGVLSVYVNDAKQGEGHSVVFNSNLPDNTVVILKAVYQVKVNIEQQHFKWKYIKTLGYTRKVCRYSYTDFRTSQLTLQEQIPAIVSNPDLTASFTIKDQYKDTIVGEFTFPDKSVNAELLFTDSSYKHHSYVFSEQYSLAPLNVLRVHADHNSNQEELNLAYANGEVIVPSTNGCKIKVSSFFKEKEIPCNLNFENVNLVARTDKLMYDTGETVTVQVEPAGNEYTVEYGGQNYTTTGTVQFPARQDSSEIIISYKGTTIRRYIHTKNDVPLNAAFSLGVFGTMNYAMIGLIRKYWGFVV